MNHDKPPAGATASAPQQNRSLWRRLRPFIRRDLKGRLISAALAASVIAGLCWFAVLAFTNLDSAAAKQVRVDLGLESGLALCHDHQEQSDLPRCSYDSRSQGLVDREWTRDRSIRAAVLDDLDLRIEDTLANLARAERILATEPIDFGNELVAGGHAELADALVIPDLRPLTWRPLFLDDGTEISAPLAAASYDVFRDRKPARTHEVLEGAIAKAREQLVAHQATVATERERETETPPASATQNRGLLINDIDLAPTRLGLQSETIAWFRAGHAFQVETAAVNLARKHPLDFDAALDPAASIWSGGWDPNELASTHAKSKTRYSSQITDDQRYALFGSILLLLASLTLLVVGPVVSATATAREREAGTLPVLRMTGMSAGDLAMAMIIGPNMFALVLGGALLVGGTAMISMTTSCCALALPLTTLLMLVVATHVTAIALGDALGQRVNAMVVGALVGLALLVPGLIGAGLAALQVSSAGLLLGPLPAPLALFSEFSGVDWLRIGHFSDLLTVIFCYSMAVQFALGLICMASWRRRIEQGWAPLFRPLDGVMLALTSIGCSALTLLEISASETALEFTKLNELTFMANVFLLPLLGWLLVASLRRPARARAVASHIEARLAFLRFQGFLLATTALVGTTYYVAVTHAGLLGQSSELMRATLFQLLLLAETSAAVLLWAARQRQHKLRIALAGGSVVLMQFGAMIGTYMLEVEQVARTNHSARLLLLGAEISPYWLAFLVLCWATGIALVLTALHRSREEQRAATPRVDEPSDEPPFDDEDDDEGLPGRRLIH